MIFITVIMTFCFVFFPRTTCNKGLQYWAQYPEVKTDVRRVLQVSAVFSLPCYLGGPQYTACVLLLRMFGWTHHTCIVNCPKTTFDDKNTRIGVF